MKYFNKFLILFLAISNLVYAQEIPNTYLVPTEVVIDPSFPGNVYSDVIQVMAVSEIDEDNRLDWVTLYNRNNLNNIEFFRYGNWRKNSNNSSFDGLQTTPFLSETFTTDFNQIMGAVFVKMRNANRKDLVVVRKNAIQVYQNQNYSLALNQNYTTFSGVAVDTGDFNIEDNYQDIVALTNGGFTIYKNNYDGTLSNNNWNITNLNNSNVILKIRARQINQRKYPYSIYLQNDKIDIITLEYVDDHGEIKIFYNDNNNNFSSTSNIDPGFFVTDFEVEDVSNDGYNDLIVSGVGSGNNIIKVFLNENGTISTTPAYTITTSIQSNPKIAIHDFNKDGYNDLCILYNNQIIDLWINNQSASLFETSPTETIGASGIINGTYSDFEAYDFSNEGGIAVADIHVTGSSSTIYRGGSRRFNAATWDKNPSPPIIFGDLLQQGGFNRPRLTIYNRGDRDLVSNLYLIYKKRPGDLDYNYLGQTEGSNVYIDYTENVYGGKGVPVNGQSVNYKVKAVDLTSNHSIFSNNALYWIDGDPPDNMLEGIYANTPERYFVANYPNPFNPESKIYYSLPEASHVRIVVYNSIGQIVNILTDKLYSFAGNYEVIFDGSNLASGLYFYSIEITKEGSLSSSFREVKKMVLLK